MPLINTTKSLLCVLVGLVCVSGQGTVAPTGGTGDYNEHLEIDFDDQDDTPPPWEGEDSGAAFTSPPKDAREDTDWVPDAVRDVAYYLRQFKFNEYDRRYPAGNASERRGFAAGFPTLRSLHWEVRDACEEGFLECLRLLQDRLSLVRLRRSDDTVKAMLDNQLSWPVNVSEQAPADGVYKTLEDKMRFENKEQVVSLDKMCTDLRADDEENYGGYVGALDRFQWRATGAYYMCAFTMQGEPALRHLGEPCDNFAWCLDWEAGPHNADPRARDSEPFQCARYSFCPDPCCPRRVVKAAEDCAEDDPCRRADVKLAELAVPKRPRCSLPAAANTNLRGIVNNRWNTSCPCPGQGYHWEARYGFCVDTNECETQAPCNAVNHEECVNTEGSFSCRCGWGWTRGEAGRCVRDRAARAVAAARRGGAEVPQGERGFDVWQILEEVLVPQEAQSSGAPS